MKATKNKQTTNGKAKTDPKPLTEEENVKLAHLTFDAWWTATVGILGQLADDVVRLEREQHLQIGPDELHDVENWLKGALAKLAALRPRSKQTQMIDPRRGYYR